MDTLHSAVCLSEVQLAHRLIHVHENVSLLTLAHTGSTILSDYMDVVVGLVVGEAFQHSPQLTRSFSF